MNDLADYLNGYSYIPVITGPTASGKSSLAIDLCLKTGGELISCDSMQIYRTLDVGTAKDSREERLKVKHHMTDIIDPGQDYSVKEYADETVKVISGLLDKGKLPVVCGGTGQYVSALIYGLDYGDVEIPDEITEELYSELERSGAEVMYEDLKQIDPEAASKIHPNNTRRLIRAIAVYKATGKTFTQKNSESRKNGSLYPFKVFYLDVERELLYDRINKRVDLMFDQGLEDEARSLYSSDADRSSTCFQAIGYKEFAGYLEGNIALDEVREKIKLNSRHYAKRQMTWFRSMPDIVRIPFGTGADEIIEQIRSK